jgi:hypothetical protein
MGLTLYWMPPEAPYMPVATAGLLSSLEGAGYPATACWREASGRLGLHLDTDLDPRMIAEVLVHAGWPSLDEIPWPPGADARKAQAIKPVLEKQDHPADAFRTMVEAANPAEATFLRALLTDGALDAGGIPSRSRLLRGVKSDLSGVASRPKTVTVENLAAEVTDGPDFRKGSSGLGLGLVPEIQTFGGTTGPPASTVGSYSALLYLLLWLGVMALPPIAVVRGPVRTVGGPLVTAGDVLSWPIWQVPVGLRSLRSLFCLEAIHAEQPDARGLGRRGISAVYRAHAVKLSTMVDVYRWGEQVAR